MKGISFRINPYAIFLNNYLETRFVNCELLDSLVEHAHQTWSRMLAGTILLKNMSKLVWNHWFISDTTFSVQNFWFAPALTSHKNRNVRRMHPLAIFCTRTFFHRNFQKKKNLIFFYNYWKISFFTKNECADMRRTSAPKRGAHTHGHSHIWKKIGTHLHKNCCTRTCARTYTKGLDTRVPFGMVQKNYPDLF